MFPIYCHGGSHVTALPHYSLVSEALDTLLDWANECV